MTLVVMMVIQVLAGAAVAVGSWLILAVGVDRSNKARHRWLLVLVFGAGVWYGIEPLVLGVPTSTKPGLLFATLVAYALLRHGRQVRGAIDGDCWLGRSVPSRSQS